MTTGHTICATHLTYRLTCQSFDALLERAAGVCEICRRPDPRLGIDHDHSVGWHGVRGLLCPKCNAHMRFVDRGLRAAGEETERYVRDAWHVGRPVHPKRITSTSRRGQSRKPMQTVRIPDALWDALRAAAAKNDETASDVLRRAAENYVRRNK